MKNIIRHETKQKEEEGPRRTALLKEKYQPNHINYV